jgi:hypothetical protein
MCALGETRTPMALRPRGSEPRVSAVPPRARMDPRGEPASFARREPSREGLGTLRGCPSRLCAWGDSNSQWGTSPPAPQAGVSALPPQARGAATGTRAPLSCIRAGSRRALLGANHRGREWEPVEGSHQPAQACRHLHLGGIALGGSRTRTTALRRRGPDPNLDEDDVLAARLGLATFRL